MNSKQRRAWVRRELPKLQVELATAVLTKEVSWDNASVVRNTKTMSDVRRVRTWLQNVRVWLRRHEGFHHAMSNAAISGKRPTSVIVDELAQP